MITPILIVFVNIRLASSCNKQGVLLSQYLIWHNQPDKRMNKIAVSGWVLTAPSRLSQGQ